MKSYILTSTKFEGELYFEYHSNGFLKAFKNDSAMSLEQLAHLQRHFPMGSGDILDLAKSSQNLTLKPLPTDLSFERFWEMYNWKEFSSKATSRKVWDKLTEAERVAVLEHIPHYEAQLKKQPGIAKKYAETYLRSGNWKQ
jgi:hypothetical protein